MFLCPEWATHDLDNRKTVAEGEQHEVRFAGAPGVQCTIHVKRTN